MSRMNERVESIRRFNRFYTRSIGVLPEGHLHSPHSLAEVRVLYEVAHRDDATAAEIASTLGFDAGYLSRILRRFEEQGLVTRTRSRADARQSHLGLTKKGRATFGTLESRARHDIGALLAPLTDDDQRRVTAAMGTIERLLGRGAATASSAPLIVREPRPGDYGWVVQRHGALYAQEYGWDERFEALVARIVADYIDHLDPKRERAWIAERDGENVGCIFLVKKSATVAKLRLLLVEPSARGTGLGKRLVAECERFARQAGYRKIVLWTQSNLTAARHIYARAGYRLTAEEPNEAFGHKLVSETWELDLR
jgi:DNA-binding MarR family transcriptional regulator/N-acetylglutamate synthase-like GNAT family acetyltransferase